MRSSSPRSSEPGSRTPCERSPAARKADARLLAASRRRPPIVATARWATTAVLVQRLRRQSWEPKPAQTLPQSGLGVASFMGNLCGPGGALAAAPGLRDHCLNGPELARHPTAAELARSREVRIPERVVRDFPIQRADAASHHERFGTPPSGRRQVPRISGSGGPSTGAPSLCERIASPLDGAAPSSPATRHGPVTGATPPGGSRAARHRARATR